MNDLDFLRKEGNQIIPEVSSEQHCGTSGEIFMIISQEAIVVRRKITGYFVRINLGEYMTKIGGVLRIFAMWLQRVGQIR